MSRPYNLRWRKAKRQASALERLKQDIKKYGASKEAVDSAKLEKALACAAALSAKD